MLPLLFIIILFNTAAAKCTHQEDISQLQDNKITYSADYPRSCADAIRFGGESGIYKIQIPSSELEPFYVYCQVDPQGKAPWTIVQRRTEHYVDFFRDWQAYEIGFGNLNAGHFIGLKKLYTLTNDQLNELWIELEDFENEKRFARYKSFVISNAQQNYTLISLGAYSGTAGDNFAYNAGQQFSTKDRENNVGNCASKRLGGWWYTNCSQCNLNGKYLIGSYAGTATNGSGIVWNAFRGQDYSLKYVHMAIRPIMN